MTDAERQELEELRLFKMQHEGKALNRAFARLEQFLDMAAHDPIMSVRSFRVIAECLICLKQEIGK